jgi:ectoine hydroxylase
MTATVTLTRPPAAADPYPSRQGHPPELLPREDPVIWGDAMRGPLRPAQVAEYAERGHVTVPDLFGPEELAVLDGALDDLVAGSDRIDPARVIGEPGSDDVRSVFAIHEPDPQGRPAPLADVVRDERLAGVARQLLGSEVYIHQSRVNRKPGFRGKDFQWHSDFETWHTEDGMPRMRCLSAVVALTDNEPWNGSLLVMPGSHEWFVTCPAPTPPRNHEQSLVVQEAGVPDEASLTTLFERHGIEQCTGKAGSVLFFDSNLMHGSSSNISPAPRRNLFYVFNSVQNALVEPYAAPEPRPGHIASRSFVPV